MATEDPRRFSRRTLLRRACAAPALALGGPSLRLAPAVLADRPNDIRILEVRHEFEDFQYRAPYQFGGRSVDRVTILNVRCRVRTNAGRESSGFGSMTLGNAWAFPAASQEAGLGAMDAPRWVPMLFLPAVIAKCIYRSSPIGGRWHAGADMILDSDVVLSREQQAGARDPRSLSRRSFSEGGR